MVGVVVAHQVTVVLVHACLLYFSAARCPSDLWAFGNYVEVSYAPVILVFEVAFPGVRCGLGGLFDSQKNLKLIGFGLLHVKSNVTAIATWRDEVRQTHGHGCSGYSEQADHEIAEETTIRERGMGDEQGANG